MFSVCFNFWEVLPNQVKADCNVECLNFFCYNRNSIKTVSIFYSGDVMSPKDLSDLISQVGFPVVVTLLLLYQQMKTNDGYYQLIEQVKNLVENNTQVLNQIVAKQVVKQDESK